MRRIVLSELRHRRARTFALLAGILVATTSFSVLSGTSQTQRLDVRGTVNRSFRVQYDILVRPRGSRSAFERRTQQVQPNLLSSVFGGISLAQWRTMARLPGIAVAAPIANLGYVLATARVPVDLSAVAGRRGRVLLRANVAWQTDRGRTRLPDQPLYLYVTDRLQDAPGRDHPKLSAYLADALREPVHGRRVPVCPDTFYVEDVGAGGPFSWRFRSALSCFGRSPAAGRTDWTPFARGRPQVTLQFSFPLLLTAVDPVQEAKLSGLDRAVVSGRYLRADEDYHESHERDPTLPGETYALRQVPVLAASRPLLDMRADLTVERLSAAAARGMLRRHWSDRDSVAVLRYLRHRAPGPVVARHRVRAADAYPLLLHQLRARASAAASQSLYRPGPVAFARHGGALAARTVPKPADGVWGFDETAGDIVPPAAQDRAFRRMDPTVLPYGNSNLNPAPILQLVGSYDPGRLRTSHAPGAAPELVFQTPSLRARGAAAGRRLGGRPLVPDGNPAGYLGQPPGLLTTLRAARVFRSIVYPQALNDPPISAIRVRVAGVTGIDAVSRERIREAAERIAARTGLDVDIVAGASGAPTPVDLPAGAYGRPALAVEELWVRKGVAARVLTAIDRKSLALFALILVVCALFVTNAAGAAVRARRSELGVLACLGWSTGRLFAVVLAEVGAIGLVAGVLGGALALPLAALVGVSASLARAALAVPAAVALALLAGLVPALRAARAEPIAAVRPAVLQPRRARHPRGVAGLALVNLLRTPGRTALGALSLAIGVCALTLLLAATIAFRDVLVGTLLGNAVAVQIRGTDYVAVVATVLLGAAAVADVSFLNLRERAGELATLIATGWDDRALARLIALEGAWIGVAGALTGAAAGLAAAAAFAGALPGRLVLTSAAAAAAGALLACVAALVPAVARRRAPVLALLAQE